MVRIGQLKHEGQRAQHMTLLIEDEQTKRWISLRLSTFRKVIAFVVKHGWDRARRLTAVEKMRLGK
jgi:hypothetical protein